MGGKSRPQSAPAGRGRGAQRKQACFLNFRRLVDGCMDSYDSGQRRILQRFSKSTRFAPFCTVLRPLESCVVALCRRSPSAGLGGGATVTVLSFAVAADLDKCLPLLPAGANVLISLCGRLRCREQFPRKLFGLRAVAIRLLGLSPIVLGR